MKKTKILSSVLLILCLSSVMFLSSCGGDKTGNTIDEPEITAEYLASEYTMQLITDGASTMVGSVKITKNEDSYDVTVTEKEVVPNSDYENGYYIADTNVTKDVPLGFDARIVCKDKESNIVSSPDDFVKQHPEGSGELYTVYLMGNSAELIMVTEPEDIIVE